MAQEEAIKLFEDKQVRYIWDDEKEKYFFSVVDVIQVLTESDRPRKYWSDLKHRLEAEGSELSAKIGQLKMQASDGKKYLTDVADTEQLLRLIQSVPSKKAAWRTAVRERGITDNKTNKQYLTTPRLFAGVKYKL